MMRQKQKTLITLQGSAEIVTDLFQHAINSILYQRAVYPGDSFKSFQAHGITVFGTTDPALQLYLRNIRQQMKDWLQTGRLQQLVLVITNTITQEVVERWTFQVDTNQEVLHKGKTADADMDVISREISAIIRQITSTVSFLPLLSDPHTFDLLVYTDKDCEVPQEWEESDQKLISGSKVLELRTLNTMVHNVRGAVAYKDTEDIL